MILGPLVAPVSAAPPLLLRGTRGTSLSVPSLYLVEQTRSVLFDVGLRHARQSSLRSSLRSNSAISSQPWSNVKLRAFPAGSGMRAMRALFVPVRSTT